MSDEASVCDDVSNLEEEDNEEFWDLESAETCENKDTSEDAVIEAIVDVNIEVAVDVENTEENNLVAMLNSHTIEEVPDNPDTAQLTAIHRRISKIVKRMGNLRQNMQEIKQALKTQNVVIKELKATALSDQQRRHKLLKSIEAMQNINKPVESDEKGENGKKDEKAEKYEKDEKEIKSSATTTDDVADEPSKATTTEECDSHAASDDESVYQIDENEMSIVLNEYESDNLDEMEMNAGQSDEEEAAADFDINDEHIKIAKQFEETDKKLEAMATIPDLQTVAETEQITRHFII